MYLSIMTSTVPERIIDPMYIVYIKSGRKCYRDISYAKKNILPLGPLLQLAVKLGFS